MPCYTPPHAGCKHDDNEREHALCDALSAVKRLDEENKRILENLHDELNYYKANSDKVTAMLCMVLKEMASIHFKECGSFINVLPEGIKEWWEKHKTWDAQRNKG